jgi:uncharacterized membrane protein
LFVTFVAANAVLALKGNVKQHSVNTTINKFLLILPPPIVPKYSNKRFSNTSEHKALSINPYI